jgi:hypothetical protein
MIKLKSLLKEVSDEAYTIHRFTSCGQNAAQDFIDDNNIDGEKLVKFLKKTDNEGLRNRYMVRDIIAGRTDKNTKQKFIKSLSSLKEATMHNMTRETSLDRLKEARHNIAPYSKEAVKHIDAAIAIIEKFDVR